MTEAPDRAAARQVDVPDTPDAADRVWYLYGIVRAPRPHQEQDASGRSGAEQGLGVSTVDGTPLQLLEHGDLAAVVRPVSRHQFTDEALQERLGDPVALEEMARAHNGVIAAIHDQQAILPAKFGGVYADLEDVRTALEAVHDALLAQLGRLEGCDEWAVHVYADRAAVQGRVAVENPSMRQLRDDLETARPGRAYFLERKLETELTAATDRALDELAGTAYDQLVRSAAAGQISPSARSALDNEVEVELLRAAFLVPRAGTEAFMQAVDSLAADHDLRCQYSGPWPPYSFAAEERL